MFIHLFIIILNTSVWRIFGAVTVVSVRQGLLNGAIHTSRNGTRYNAFLGIPFAESPVGHLRFQAPVPAKPWRGIFNATATPPECVQVAENTNETTGQEDCLNLNIYTPLNAKPGDNIPVIVYIFGGIFKQNSNLDNGPDYVMDKNIILVMPNYRLGVLGFLSTGDSVIAGNMGLKDQTLALHWTKENIYAFGGDRNRITLHGHSSGAMCLHLHTFSPLSKGLFNRVIIQSGTALPNGFHPKSVAKLISRKLGERVGCSSNSSSEILQCLLTINAHVFPLIQEEMYLWDVEPDAAFRPTIEDASVENAFLTEIPVAKSYSSIEPPWLIGITTGEGAFKAAGFLSNGGQLAKELDLNYKTLFPISLQYLWSTTSQSLNYISKMIRRHYFGQKNIDDDTAIQLEDMYSDRLFGQGTFNAINDYEGLKYVYLYDYWSNYSTQNKRGTYKRIGISHAEEVHLIFRHESSASSLTLKDIAFGDELITRLINFAYSGNPNEPFLINEKCYDRWTPVQTKRIEFLRIKINGAMETDFWNQSRQFWKTLPIDNEYFNE